MKFLIAKISFLTFFLLFFVVLINSCNEMTQIDIQGHRGCRGLMPENTLVGFEKAIEIGVTTLELDIVISKDKKIVVSHEPFMNSLICITPDGQAIQKNQEKEYNLYQMSYDSIKSFDCGTTYHPHFPKQEKLITNKPLLSDVFNLVKNKKSKVKFNIELKSEQDYYGIFSPFPNEYVKLVLHEIENSGLAKRVTLQSFDVNILEEISKQAPHITIALLVDENENIWNKISLLNTDTPDIISPYYKLLDEKKIQNLKAEGFKVIPWTINDLETMREFIKWEVEGIITDYPDVLIEMMKSKQ